MTDRAKIIDKIRKCLALGTSSNEHEAAAALRQANKLMQAHGITDLDVAAAEATERQAKAGAARKPSNWETMLACKVADSFCCKVIFSSSWKGGRWGFIGCGAAPELAQYAFEVLLRQAKRARDTHIKTNLKRCKTATKTRRADLFSDGWVMAVTETVEAFAGNEQQTAAIDAYTSTRYPSLIKMDARDRNADRKISARELNDWFSGTQAGGDAQLNRGVSGLQERKALA